MCCCLPIVLPGQELLNKKDMVGDCFNQLRLARQRALNEGARVSAAGLLGCARACSKLLCWRAWLALPGPGLCCLLSVGSRAPPTKETDRKA